MTSWRGLPAHVFQSNVRGQDAHATAIQKPSIAIQAARVVLSHSRKIKRASYNGRLAHF